MSTWYDAKSNHIQPKDVPFKTMPGGPSADDVRQRRSSGPTQDPVDADYVYRNDNGNVYEIRPNVSSRITITSFSSECVTPPPVEPSACDFDTAMAPSDPEPSARVHFDGFYLGPKAINMWQQKIFDGSDQNNFADILGPGDYPNSGDAIPNAISGTLDALAIAPGTRLIFWSSPNYQGTPVLDVTGPAIINGNFYENIDPPAIIALPAGWATDGYDDVVPGTSGTYGEIFPPSSRRYATAEENPHLFGQTSGAAGGSFKIRSGCEKPSTCDFDTAMAPSDPVAGGRVQASGGYFGGTALTSGAWDTWAQPWVVNPERDFASGVNVNLHDEVYGSRPDPLLPSVAASAVQRFCPSPIGAGDYPNTMRVQQIYDSAYFSLDGFIVDRGTTIRFYKEPNFQGGVEEEITGPICLLSTTGDLTRAINPTLVYWDMSLGTTSEGESMTELFPNGYESREFETLDSTKGLSSMISIIPLDGSFKIRSGCEEPAVSGPSWCTIGGSSGLTWVKHPLQDKASADGTGGQGQINGYELNKIPYFDGDYLWNNSDFIKWYRDPDKAALVGEPGIPAYGEGTTKGIYTWMTASGSNADHNPMNVTQWSSGNPNWQSGHQAGLFSRMLMGDATYLPTSAGGFRCTGPTIMYFLDTCGSDWDLDAFIASDPNPWKIDWDWFKTHPVS